MIKTLTQRTALAGLLVASLVVGALASAGGNGSPVNANPHDPLPEVAEARIGDSVDAAELEDLFFMAEREEISLEEAIERFGWQDNFALVIDEIRHLVPDLYVDSEITGAQQAWVAFSGAQPKASAQPLAEFSAAHPDVDVEIRTNVGTAERDLDEAMWRAHSAVRELPMVDQVVAWGEGDTLVLTVVLTDDARSPASLAQVVATAEAAVSQAEGAGAVDVEVRQSDQPVPVTEDSV